MTPTDPRRPSTPTRAQRAIGATAERLPEHVPAERREDVVRSAWRWWAAAAAFLVVAFAFIGFALYLVAMKVEIGITLGVLLGAFVAVPVAAALFCANMASRSATNATLRAIGALIGLLRGRGRATDDEPPGA